MKLLALVSCYREGTLVQEAIRSGLDACDSVLVFEGPAGEAHGEGEPSDLRPFLREPRAILREGEWDSDADKRTAMLRWTHRYDKHPPVWGVWIDGDEVLLWGRYLRDIIRKAEADAHLHEEPLIRVPLKLVEMDGEVRVCGAKVLRLDRVDEIVESSYQVRLRGSELVYSLGNQPSSLAPYQGEPHLLHRAMLRPTGRDMERLGFREPNFYEREFAKVVGPEKAREITMEQTPHGLREQVYGARE